MTNVMCTAFLPFGYTWYGKKKKNISEEVLKNLSGVDKYFIPTSFLNVDWFVDSMKEQIPKPYTILLGQCKEGEKIRMERFAWSLIDCEKPDCMGVKLKDKFFDGLKKIYTNVEFPDHFSSVMMRGLNPTYYVCNYLYYKMLKRDENTVLLHIPKNMDVEFATEVIQNYINTLQ